MEIMLETIHRITIMGLRGMILDYPHDITHGLRMGVPRVVCDTITIQATSTITIIHHHLCIIINHQFIHDRLHRHHHHHRVGLCRQEGTYTHLVTLIRDLPYQSRGSLGPPDAAIGLINTRHIAHITHLNRIILHIMMITDPKERPVGRLDRIHRTAMTITTTIIIQIITKVVEVLRCHV